MPSRLSRNLPHILLAAYVVLCLAALAWPLYPLVGGRLTPRILGLPPAFAWNLAWVVLSFFVLLVYDRATRPREKR